MFYTKTNSLPRPRLTEVLPPPEEIDKTLMELIGQKKNLSHQLGLVQAKLDFIAYSACGGKDDSQDVELYDGTLGVTRKFVDDHQAPVGQLQWSDNLQQLFAGRHEDPGNVSGERWATGALIAGDLFLTAGHCFSPHPPGWQVPTRYNIPISPPEIAKLMFVNFDYQVDGRTGRTKPGVSFPIVGLLEYPANRGFNYGVDYAIAKLGHDASGRKPHDLFGTLEVADEDLTTVNAMLCIIQHPSRREKKIEAGPMLDNRAGRIFYDSIDTAGGASGAPILGPDGKIVGVHGKGGCSDKGGFNSGVSIGAIRAASDIL